MSLPDLIAEATNATATVVRGVRPAQLDLPTPCAEWDVRRLVNHLTHWAATVSELAAGKQAAPVEEPDHTAGDWPALFAERAQRAARAWAQPGALAGTTTFAGTELPAELCATVLLGELVLHGWDLAVATGQRYGCPPAVAAAVLGMLTTMGPQGRSMGVFGDEVTVPDGASPLDRVLAAGGRDPGWRPQLTSSAQTRQSSSTP